MPLDLALVGVAPLEVGVCVADLDEGLELVAEEDGATEDVVELEAAAPEEDPRFSLVFVFVMDRERVTRPPAAFLPEDAGEFFPAVLSALFVGVTGVVGRPPSLDTPDLFEPLESCPESHEE